MIRSFRFLTVCIIACIAIAAILTVPAAAARTAPGGAITDQPTAVSRVLRGTVHECRTGMPVELAVVTVMESGFMTLSDSKGSFSLDLPSGASRVHVNVVHVAYVQVPSVEVDISRESLIDVCLEWEMYETPVIEVTAELPTLQPLLHGRIEMDPGRLSDGAMSITDPLHALKKMPQVTAGADFDGRFSLHGSSPDANAFFLDGLLFPSPYHLGGLCSIYDAANMKRFCFSPAPFTAAAHGATGAVVEVETKDGTQGQDGREFSLGLMSSSMSDQRFFADGAVFTSLLARRSYIDLLYDTFADNRNMQIPNFFDVQAGVTMSIDERRYVKAGFLISGDEMFMNADGIVDSEGEQATEIGWSRRMDAFSLTYGLREGKAPGWTGRALLGWQPYRSSFEIGGSDDERMDWKGGRGTVRVDLSRRHGNGMIGVGLFTSVSSIEYDINFARGFWLAGRNENSAVRLDNDGWAFSTKNGQRWLYTGTYGEFSWTGERTGVRVGTRLEAFERSREFFAGPRVTVYRSLPKETTLMLSGGFFARDPAEDFGNPAVIGRGIRTEKAGQMSLGARKRFGGGVLLQLGGFVRREWDLPVEVEPATFRSGGAGRSGGLSMGAEGRFGKVDAFASYAFTRAERMDSPYTLAFRHETDGDLVTGLGPVEESPYWYTSPYEYRHSFQLEARANVTEAFSVSFSWRLHTGRPFTPIDDVHERAAGGYVASEGRKMSDRLPPYSRIDVHAEWRYPRAAVFVEVLNLTNRRNVFNLRYNIDYSRRTFYRMLPIMPAFGVKVFF